MFGKINRKWLRSTVGVVGILAGLSNNVNMLKSGHKGRGALIVFEGCDRSGKTTQCGLLHDKLSTEGHDVKLLKFPDRTTIIGHMINDYLTCKKELNDHAIHLLFSANRWENVGEMQRLLESGTTLIVDRYAFSGVAFTAAKEGFDMDWCKQADIGLPRPDAILYLTVSQEAAAKRAGYGDERYEQSKFQQRVMQNYAKLKDADWMDIDADSSVEDIHRQLVDICKTIMTESAEKPLYKLWTQDSFEPSNTIAGR